MTIQESQGIGLEGPSPVIQPPSATHCLFEEDWWLDAVAPGQWEAVEVISDGAVQARLPFVLSKSLGLNSIKQPALTQTLGPWFRDTGGKLCTKLSREKDLTYELIDKLPRCSSIQIHLNHRISNFLPFYWKGFCAEPKVTYVLRDLTNLDKLWANLQENIRREIRKAEKRVQVCLTDDIDEFLVLNRMTWERQSLPFPSYTSIVRRIDATCARRNARRIYIARDENGNPHAGLYIVHDERCAYYLLGGGDPKLRSSGATSLLMWNAIKDSAKSSKIFDFEGSMTEPIERFFRAFGAEQATFFALRKNTFAGASERVLRSMALTARAKAFSFIKRKSS